MAAPATQPRRIAGLDGIRACAITLVFLAHSVNLPCGWLGVQLFFVLSGYLITPILVEMRASRPHGYFRAFYGRRTLRIFPAAYLYLALMVPLSYGLVAWLGPFDALTLFPGQAPYAVLYVYNFFHASSAFAETSLLSHFWSLGVEEQTYLLWPLLIALAGRRLLPVLVGLAVAGPLLRAATWLAGTGLDLPFLNEDVKLAIYVLPWSYLDAFALGGLAALWPRTASRLVFVLAWITLATAGYASEWLATGQIGRLTSLGYELTLPNAYKFLWGYSLLNGAFALLIQRVDRHAFGCAFLELRPVRYVGKISYGLYIIHFPVIFLVQATLLQSGRSPDPWLVVPVAAALSLALAGASHHYVEAPILAHKDRLFPRRATS